MVLWTSKKQSTLLLDFCYILPIIVRFYNFLGRNFVNLTLEKGGKPYASISKRKLRAHNLLQFIDDAAIMLVHGNIRSDKIVGTDLPVKISTTVWHKSFAAG